MSDPPKSARKRVFTLVKITAIAAMTLIAIPGTLIAFVWYANRSAEREAREFCDGIAQGTDIALAIAKMEKQTGFEKRAGEKTSVRHVGFPDEGLAKNSHTFIYPGFIFDKAECTVWLDQNGKVTSSFSKMLYD
jgi:hypothetical protein